MVAVGVVLYLARRLGSLGWAFALGFLLAGVAGNLTDRLVREPGPLRGHVIDFFMLPHWPVFNVADMCIDAAAVLILIQVYRGHPDRRHPRARGEPAAAGARANEFREPITAPCRCPRGLPASASTRRWRGSSASPAAGPQT